MAVLFYIFLLQAVAFAIGFNIPVRGNVHKGENAITAEFSPPRIPEINQEEQRLLKIIEDKCFTRRDIEELYDNKSKAGLVVSFGDVLVEVACVQMGLNELRRRLGLRQQPINFTGRTTELYEFHDDNTVNSKLLSEFLTMEDLQEKIAAISNNPQAAVQFWPTDVNVAEEFLDKHLPEVRQLYRLKIEEYLGYGLFAGNLFYEINDVKYTILSRMNLFTSVYQTDPDYPCYEEA